MRGNHAFSLVELALAIALVGILVALALPEYQNVVERARSTACMSNLRQIGIAVGTYLADNDNTFPFVEPNPADPVYDASYEAKPMLDELEGAAAEIELGAPRLTLISGVTGGQAGAEVSFIETVKTAWSNIPFRVATLLYMLNWITFDLVALVLPFYLVYWISSGNLLATANVFGISLPIESAVFALLLITAILALPIWLFISRKMSKKNAYIAGMSFWAVVQLVLFFVPPGDVSLVLLMSVLAGISVSSAHVLPDSIFPDVIEWDELRTRRRQEGIYYGVKNFIRKLTGALAIFIALQALGWFGYQAPHPGVTVFAQSARALTAIRVLIGPFGALLLFSAIIMAWFYPLTRERHARIRRLLERRKARAEESLSAASNIADAD